MKHCLILLLLELLCTACLFSQDTLLEFIIEKDDSPQVFYKNKGCTPDVGAIVFYTTIPDLQFNMPDTKSRLKNASIFDNEKNCYVLCVQPTDTKIGGITQYSIEITGTKYKPMPAYMVKGIMPGVAQYFKIKTGEDLKAAVDSLKKELEKMRNVNVEMISWIEQKPVSPTTPAASVYYAMNWYMEGLKNRNAGNYSEAIECFKKIAESPSVAVWNEIGICYKSLKQYDDAIDCFQKSNNIDSRGGTAWYNMGLCYGDKNKLSKSIECLKKSAQLGNENAQKLLRDMKKKW